MLNLFNSLTPFMFLIEVGVLGASVSLLLGSAMGLYLQGRQTTEPRSESRCPANSSEIKQRAPRAKADGVIEILDGHGLPAVVGRMLNMSIGGIGLLTLKEIPPGTPIMARFRVFPSVPPMTVPARVIWSRTLSSGFLYGIQYKSTTPTKS